VQKLPDLLLLTSSGKDDLIRALFDLQMQSISQLQKTAEIVQSLTARIKVLEDQLSKTSRNSSKPPSSDGFKKTKSQRQASDKKVGGQPGHKGTTLERTEHPDHIVQHPLPQHYAACNAALLIDQA
jgi:transposase